MKKQEVVSMKQWWMKFILILTMVFALMSGLPIMTHADGSSTLFYDNFDYQPLTGWEKQVSHGTQFSQSGNTIRIIHSTAANGFDNIRQTFDPLAEAVIEFDAKIGSVNNDNFSLLLESDGGYTATDGLGLAFQGNQVMTYVNNGWQSIYTVPFDTWQHYRIVSTAGWIAVYINDDLKYRLTGSFRIRSYIKFSDFGSCSGAVTNYLANVRFHPAIDNDKFIVFDDFNNGTLNDWVVTNPNNTQFIPENGIIRINHARGTWGADYIQRSFHPVQNVVLEFDAKINMADGNSLVVQSDVPGFHLSFYQNNVNVYNPSYLRIGIIAYNVWNHYRLVFTANRIEVYINGVLKYTATGTYNPRSYFRFSNAGTVAVNNYIDNVCIRTQVPASTSTNSPDWTSDWTIQNPNGTQFLQTDNWVTINHVIGTEGDDYLQRSFNPLQNVAFEFEAKIGSVNNTDSSLLIASDGGSQTGGLYLSFFQNALRGYFSGSWQNIQTVGYDEWNHYRIISTMKTIEVYVNGILKYTLSGTFNPRSFLRFSNAGYCTPTNYIRNISIQEVIPDATFTNHPDWARNWVVHNPNGTLFIRENDAIRIHHATGTWGADYIQRSFHPVQNVVLEFDAKINMADGNSLVVQSDVPGFHLSFYQNNVDVYNPSYLRIGIIAYNVWNHYRLVFTANRIEVYINGMLKYTATGTYNPRSYFRFSNAGAVVVNNYIDNVCIQSGLPQDPTPPYLNVRTPVDGQITKDSVITVSGEVSTQVPVQVTVNGQPATVSAGTFTLNGVALTEGDNPLTVIATEINGGTSQTTLTVKRDSTPPGLSNISPADGTYFNTAHITVSGQVSDMTPVTVTVNGTEASVANGWFSIDIPINEGQNFLNIVARDAAGNLSSSISSVFGDTQPPAAFTPAANPAGWTQNNRPTITFGTTDAESGLDHYEIAIGEGAWLTPVTSPYTFTTPIPDGEQTVRVKAVDTAGNYTIGTVVVYIDTTPPAVPEGFEVIPGINRVITGWQDPLGEIARYRLYRNPAFSGVPYREITRTTEGVKIERYDDTEVEPGTEYSYSFAAIDHAGNISSNTASIQVKVGVAVQTVDTEAAVVKFENCQLTLAEEALAEPGKVIIEKSNELFPASDFATPVDVTYSIILQNQAGQEIEALFCEPVSFQVSYHEIQLPEGFTPQDLGVYWYNREGGYWERVDDCINNTAEKTLAVNLKHFSEYKVMASKYTAPSLDFYYNLGVAPFMSYFQNNMEQVSTASGSLSVIATDLKIPGPEGLDLEIQRSYDSGAAEYEVIMGINRREYMVLPPNKPLESFGGGWSLNLPWVETPSDDGQFLRLPEGQTLKINWKDNRFVCHGETHFILERQTYGYPVFLGWREVTAGYTLTLKDGTRYQFDDKGRPSYRIDPSGKFRIDYSYAGERILAGISDTAGRTISFGYSGNKIVRIWSGSGADRREVNYHYDQNGNLDKVTDPLNRETLYHYTGLSYRYGTGTVKSTTIQLLTGIDYPTGGKSLYTIETKSQDYIPSGGNQTRFGQRFMVKEHSLEGKITRYDYLMNNSYGTMPPNTCVIGAVVTEGYYEEAGSSRVFHGEKQVRETYRPGLEIGSRNAQG